MKKQDVYESLLRHLVHDISNPLVITQVVASRIRSQVEAKTALERDIDALIRASTNVLEMVQKVKSLLAVRAGKIDLKTEQFNFVALVRDVIDLQFILAEKKSVKISLQVQSESIELDTDRSLLRNAILTNLLSNAIKFSPTHSEVFIVVTYDSRFVYLDIADSGEGVPENLREIIFDPQAQTTRTDSSGELGTGFGLPLVKEFAMFLGGDIELISTQELLYDKKKHGANFRLRIPYQFSKSAFAV